MAYFCFFRLLININYLIKFILNMRTLKFHEKKLLKKVDFLDWKNEDNLREIKIMRRYYVQNRDDLKM